MDYDFQSARDRSMELVTLHRRLKYNGDLTEEASDFIVERLVDIEEEIVAAKRKMTAGEGSHLLEQLKNINVPIISSVGATDKEAVFGA